MQVVRQVLQQATLDGRIPHNPAQHVRLPGAKGVSTTAVVDDPAQYLTAQQIAALQSATPWPYNYLVHLAAWSGLRAGELCGLQVGDVRLPANTAPTRAGHGSAGQAGQLNVVRTVVLINGALQLQEPKTLGSRRRVPLPPATTALLAEYLADHPRRDDPTAPLFPGMPPGRGAIPPQDLDWGSPLRHAAWYGRVFKPAVRRANLPSGVVFHSLRHTYVSLCIAAGIPPLEISRFAGHSNVTTTLGIYAHLFESDHSAAMGALGAMAAPATGNVVPLRAAQG
jgi:integrase